MTLFYSILLASLVKIRSTEMDLFKRDTGPLKTVIEFEWNDQFLIFRVEQDPISVYIDGIEQNAMVFKGYTDGNIKGVFTMENNTWQGAFESNGTIYHAFPHTHDRAIEKRESYHYITKAEENEFNCQSEHHIDELQEEKVNLRKRSDVSCPSSTKVLPTCIAVDCNYYNQFKEQTTTTILQEIGLASMLLERNINVGLSVRKIDIKSQCGDGNDGATWNSQCSSTTNAQSKLNEFTKWKQNQKEDCGIWHLMTQCSYKPTLGIAWIDSACKSDVRLQGKEYVSNTGLSSVINDGFKVIAHEILHNLGAVHDCSSGMCNNNDCTNNNCGCCPCTGCDCKGSYLMHPALTTSSDLSPCSKKDVCANILFSNSCLLEEQRLNFQSVSYCGNGILENGEECDSGVEDNCCTSTCKLKPNAKCSDSNHKCCESCQLSSKDRVCAGGTECDLTRNCDGQSPFCPINSYSNNGNTCATGRCSNGLCTNPDEQCQLKGNRLGMTKSCSTECSMKCQSNNGVCTDMNTYLLDGSSCSYNGTCSNGVCLSGDAFGAIALWISQNAILVAFLSLTLVGIIVYSIIKYRKRSKSNIPPPTPSLLQ